MVRAILFGWPGLIRKCCSPLFLEYGRSVWQLAAKYEGEAAKRTLSDLTSHEMQPT